MRVSCVGKSRNSPQSGEKPLRSLVRALAPGLRSQRSHRIEAGVWRTIVNITKLMTGVEGQTKVRGEPYTSEQETFSIPARGGRPAGDGDSASQTSDCGGWRRRIVLRGPVMRILRFCVTLPAIRVVDGGQTTKQGRNRRADDPDSHDPGDREHLRNRSGARRIRAGPGVEGRPRASDLWALADHPRQRQPCSADQSVLQQSRGAIQFEVAALSGPTR